MNTEFSKKYLRIFINIYKYKNHTVITRRLRTEEAVLNSKKITQKDINPFSNSDTNKRYYTYDYWLRKTFGGKCMKIPIDAGFTCPNIDGKCSVGGCIYCSPRGSGDFACTPLTPPVMQFEAIKEKLSSKWKTDKYIPYFQAHTNTYAPVSVLREKFEPVLRLDGVVGMNIATRADCIDREIAAYLADIANRTLLTVELGLQTAHDKTAFLINRGHTYRDFLDGYELLKNASDKIRICVHLIYGLPGENRDIMIESTKKLASLVPDQVKLHLLHVLKNTEMEKMYLSGKYIPLSMEEYINIVCEALCVLPPDTVIGRITGDGMQSELIAPDWSRKKTIVINNIDKKMFADNLWQGKYYTPQGQANC